MPKFLSNIDLETANDMQFKTTAGVAAGKIEQDGNDLVLSNAVGDVLLGDGTSDVYIGDGTNNVDILFEQSGAIKGDGSAVTLTLGGSGTTLALGSPISSDLTVGVNDTGHDVKFFGATAGSYMLWDQSEDGLQIIHPTGGAGLEVYTVSQGAPNSPQFKVGRASTEYWGVYTEDRTAHLIHRQDETDGGAMNTSFELWGGGSGNDNWVWKHGTDTGGSLATVMTLDKAGLLTVTGEVEATGLDINGNADISGNLTGVDALTISGILTMDSADVAQLKLDSAASNDSVIYFQENAVNKAKMGFDSSAAKLAVVIGTGAFSTTKFTLDATDMDIATALTVGVDDTGHDVKFFGATSGSYMLWDESADTLNFVNSKINMTGSSGSQLSVTAGNAAWDASINLDTSGANGQWQIKAEGSDETFQIVNIDQGGTAPLTIHPTTKATTFAGNVGIGTASPAYKLSVNGDIQTNVVRGYLYPTQNVLSLEDDNLPNQNGVSLQSVGSMAHYIDVNNNSSNDSFDWLVDDNSAGSATNLMRLTDEGNLGIGTTSPDAKLHVYSTGNGEAIIERASGAKILLQAQSAAGVIGTSSNHDLDIKTNGSTRVKVENTGNVGIGTTTPGEVLDVVGNIAVSGTVDGVDVAALAAANTGDQTLPTDFVSATSGGTFGGNVTVGSNSLTAGSLDINGNADISGNLTVDGGLITIDQDAAGAAFTWKESDGTTVAGQMRGYANRGDIYLYTDGTKTTEISAIGDSFIPALHIGGSGAASGGVLQTTGSVNIDGDADISGTIGSGAITSTGNIRLPNSGKLYTWTDHDLNFLDYDNWQASASGGMTINNVASTGEIYLKSGNALALTLDENQAATFAGTIGSGAITSTGKIQGAELEGTSLDINGSGNLSGTLTIPGSFATTILDGDNVVVQKPDFSSGGWARSLMNFKEHDGTTLYAIGAYGNNNTFSYGYIGVAYNDTTMRWAADKTVTFGGNVTAGGNSLTAGSLDINGSADISGNITSAGWTGDVIASSYLDSDTAHLSTTQTFTGIKTFDRLYESYNGTPITQLGTPSVRDVGLFDSMYSCKTDASNDYNDLTDLVFYKQDADGDAWDTVTVSDDEKRRFLRGAGSGVISSNIVIPHGTFKYRVEFHAKGYTAVGQFYLYSSYNGNPFKLHMWAQRTDTDAWEQKTSSDANVAGWPGHTVLPFSTIWFQEGANSSTKFDYIRLEFTPSWNHASNDINLFHGSLWGGYPAGRRTQHYYDQNDKIFLPGDADISGDLTVPSKIIHAGDTNTWVGFDDGNDTFRAVVGGSEKFHVNSSRTRISNNNLEVNGDLDLNGAADISGTLTVATISATDYGLASADIPNNGANTTGSSGSCTGNAATATLATTVTVTDNENTAENNLIAFVADAGDGTGAHGLEMDGNLHYNPSTGLLTSTSVNAASFTGDLEGDVTGNLTGTADVALTADVATHVVITDNESTNENNQITFIENATGSGQRGLESDGDFHYNPSTGTVTATIFNGEAATVATNANLTGHITSTGNAAVLGAFSSADLLGALTDETGTGSAVFASNAVLTAPVLGTPASGNLANCYGINYYAHVRTAGTTAGDTGAGAEIIQFGTGSVVAGKIYQYSGGVWTLANATAESSSSKLLGVARSTNASAAAAGMCIRGMVTLAVDTTGADGDVLWLKTADGDADDVAPTGNTHIARVIGYCQDNGKRIFFNPDSTFVEITA